MNNNHSSFINSKRRFNDIAKDLHASFPKQADLILHTSLKKADACQIEALIADIQPKSILEIGSFCGISTRWLSSCSPTMNITCVDPWISDGTIDSEAIFDHINAIPNTRIKKIKAYFGSRNNQSFSVPTKSGEDTKAFAYEHQLPLYFPKQYFDLVFIDGDHRTSSSINAFMLTKEVSENIIYHDANLRTHQNAMEIIEQEWSGEWAINRFPNGEDGLAHLTKLKT
ncbi:class I SAM-dependent methyltransferase [Shewanella woodyi]|uniref:class I SAM-dependent methyltransferase n=1 Tax=Shewanella woodyi TaxID=60961 RepID=UPI003749D2EC